MGKSIFLASPKIPHPRLGSGNLPFGHIERHRLIHNLAQRLESYTWEHLIRPQEAELTVWSESAIAVLAAASRRTTLCLAVLGNYAARGKQRQEAN